MELLWLTPPFCSQKRKNHPGGCTVCKQIMTCIWNMHLIITVPEPAESFFSGNKTVGRVAGSSKPCRSATTRCIAMQNSSKLRALSLFMSERCLKEMKKDIGISIFS